MITPDELETRAKTVSVRLALLSDVQVLVETRDYVDALRAWPSSRTLRFGANLLRTRAEAIVLRCGFLPYVTSRYGTENLFDSALEESAFRSDLNAARLVGMLEQAMGHVLGPQAKEPEPGPDARPARRRRLRLVGGIVFAAVALVGSWSWAGLPRWLLLVVSLGMVGLGALVWWWATRDLYKRVAITSLVGGIGILSAPSMSFLVETSTGDRANAAIGGGTVAGVSLIALCAYALWLHSRQRKDR